MATVYAPFAPAATLPSDGKAKQLQLFNPAYNGVNSNSPSNAIFHWFEERFTIDLQSVGQLFIGARTLLLPDVDGVAGGPINAQRSFFDWLSVYQQKAVTDAQVFIFEEKTRAEGAEGLLSGRITDEKTRAEGAEGVLRADIVTANTAITSNATAIANILNGSPEHLNQLTEIVADYTANGATVTTALEAEVTYARAEAADLRTRVAALETLVASLINSA